MKALSIKQPYAELIARGDKLVENRPWRTHFRGPLAIHASSRRGVRAIGSLCDEHELAADALDYQAIIAIADVVDCLPIDELHANRRKLALFPELADVDTKFAVGPWCWVLANVRRLEKPIEIVGNLSLWDVPPAIERRLKRLL